MTHDHSHPHHGNSHDHNDEHGHSHAAPEPKVMPAAATQALHDRQAEKRNARRAMFSDKTVEDVLEMNEDAWKARSASTEVVVAATEELLARTVLQHFPTAVLVTLYEDVSHDAPHGHLERIEDVNGHVLILGTSDTWHDLSWSQEVDEYVWDLHHLDRDGFVLDGNRRRRHIPMSSQA